MQHNKEVLLSELVQNVPAKLLVKHTLGKEYEFPITGIVLDSRKVEPGYLFVALKGELSDGHDFIDGAIQSGARAVVGTAPIGKLAVPYIQVTHDRQALAYFSAAFYKYPAHQMIVVGVTGTDGKTTTSKLIYQILVEAGLNAGMITTVNAVVGNEDVDTGFHVTTPEAPDIQKLMAWMAFQQDKPVSHIVLESTSHGLAQDRVTGCEFDIGVITNITHEHLDYHRSFEAYRQAKSRLFTQLADTPDKRMGNIRLAVLNRQDDSYEYLSELIDGLNPRVRQVSYGFHPKADIRPEKLSYNNRIQSFDIVRGSQRFEVDSHLPGAYNVSNCLAAFTTAVEGLRVDPNAALKGIEAVHSIPGRMEFIDMGQGFKAVIDFAHTPNALKNVLSQARKMVCGRIVSVFGSAGLRDREKRRMMAEISAQMSDITILTAEDPRTESVEIILKEMAVGLLTYNAVEGKTFWRIPDRREAMRFAIQLAQEGDMVIAFGKGHEQSMCFGETEYPWDDRVAMRAALAERLGIQGPAMPYLPD
jgi:UDP-N-acetylmuramoyl-L-alanyl-D-glutamate--2,6-diaminopimelate ligase